MSEPRLPHTLVRTIDADRLDTTLQVAANSAAEAQRLRQIIRIVDHWLLTLPDDAVVDQIRRDGRSLLRGEPEPGRD